MQKVLFAFLLVFLVCTSVNAATGCVNASRTIIYTTSHPSGYWRSNSGVNAPNGCLYNTSGTPCNIQGGAANEGLLGDDTSIACPIDDYVWVMMILFGGLGYFVLRKNNLKQSIA